MDIETIPDWSFFRLVSGLPPETTMEELRAHVAERFSSGFLPPPFHIPFCIALIDVDGHSAKVVNATVLESQDEKTLLQHFWRIVRFRKGREEARTTLVHFNGRGFDLPVLFYRSLKHRVPVVTWERSRYNFEFSHDLCDDLAEFGASGRPSLDIVAKLIGLPGKTDVRGSQVEEMYLKGEKARIKDYCMDDALTTYHVWLTLRLVRGEISEDKYREAFDSAEQTVRESRTVTDNYFAVP